MKNFSRSLILTLFCLPFFVTAQNPQWQYLGDTLLSGWNTISVLTALDEGNPNLAILAYDNIGEVYWSVLHWNGSEWIQTDTTGLGQLNYTTFHIDNEGNPLLAYYKDDTKQFGIKRRQNGVWSTLTESPQMSGSPYYTSITFENNQLWASFTDLDQNNRAFVWTYDGSTWHQVGQGAISTGSVYPLILQIDNGIPWVAFREIEQGYAALVKKFNGTDWESVGGTAFDSNIHGQMDFAVHNGKPYLIHTDSGTQHFARVLGFNGASWEPVGSPMIIQASYYLELAIDDQTNHPFFMFDDSAPGLWGLSAMRFDGNEWKFAGERGFVDNFWSLSLLFYEGTPFIGYMKGPFGGPASCQVFGATTPSPIPHDAPLFFNIHPNPVSHNHLTLYTQTDRATSCMAVVLDVNGSIYLNKPLTLSPGENTVDIGLPELPAGSYFLQIRSITGDFQTYKKFVIVR